MQCVGKDIRVAVEERVHVHRWQGKDEREKGEKPRGAGGVNAIGTVQADEKTKQCLERKQTVTERGKGTW